MTAYTYTYKYIIIEWKALYLEISVGNAYG